MTEGTPSAGPSLAGLGQVRHLARHSALLLSSGVVSYAGALVLNVLLARVLGKAGFGAWAVAFAMAQLLSVLGLLGANGIILRNGSYYQSIGDEPRLRQTIYFGLLLSGAGLVTLGVLLFAISPMLGRSVFHSPSIVPLLRLTSLIGPIIGVRQMMLFGTQAFRDMRDVALNTNILEPFARLACVGVALLLARSQFSGFIGLLIAEVLLAAAAVVALHRRLPFLGPRLDIERRKLVRFALPIWGSNLIETTRGQLFPVLVGSLAALASSAVFVASVRIVAAPVLIIGSMNQVFTPMGSSLYLQGRKLELETLFKSISKWSFALGLPLFGWMVAFPSEILALFGSGFQGNSGVLVVLAVGTFFQFSTGPVTVTLILAGRPRLALLDYIVVVATEIGLAVWLIPSHGALGAGVALMVGVTLNNLLPLVQVRHILGFHPYRLDFWKPAAAGALAVGLTKLVTRMALRNVGAPTAVAAAAIIGVLYVGFLLLFRLSSQDRAAVQAVLRWRGERAKSRSHPNTW